MHEMSMSEFARLQQVNNRVMTAFGVKAALVCFCGYILLRVIFRRSARNRNVNWPALRVELPVVALIIIAVTLWLTSMYYVAFLRPQTSTIPYGARQMGD